MSTDEKRVTINECEIFYLESDNRAQGDDAGGPSIVYIHGNLGSARWFNKVMDVKGRRVLAMEMPNFGRSGRIAEHDIATYADYVTAFIREVAGPPVVLVGHSLGGAVAMAVASGSPDLVGELLLVDSAPVEGLATPEAYHPAIEAYRTDENQLRAALKTVVPTLNDDEWFEELVEDAKRMKGEAYIGHAVELGKADFRDVAGNYAGPVLVVRGAMDMLVNAEMATRTAAAFHGTAMELPDVGHSVMVEDPGLFGSTLAEFISG